MIPSITYQSEKKGNEKIDIRKYKRKKMLLRIGKSAYIALQIL